MSIRQMLGKIWSRPASADKKVAAPDAALVYARIPAHSEMALQYMSYPQVHGIPIQPRPVEFFCRRYADELHALLDALPLTQSEIDQLLMPLIGKLISWGNVLPASEFHHHAGVGGLFVHSLQCASSAVALVENMELGRRATLHDQYHNKDRWVVAAAIMALLHDIGKIFDLHVVLEDGSRWNPAKESLLEWATERGVKTFFVVWRSDREHKGHELRSIRLMYSDFLNQDMVKYLSQVTEDEILTAIEDAVVFGKGPLAAVLHGAEEASIKLDAEDRRKIGAGLCATSSPAIAPLLQAMRALIVDGVWKVNKPNAEVLVTTKGVFLALTDASAQQIHDKAKQALAPYVPASAGAVARLLTENGLLEISGEDKADVSNRWLVRFQGWRQPVNCFKIKEPLLLLRSLSLPEAVPAEVTAVAEAPEALTDVAGRASQLLAPTTSFVQMTDATRPRQKEDDGRSVKEKSDCCVSKEELRSMAAREMTVGEIKAFIDRLLTSACHQMKGGGGFLIDGLRQLPDGTLVCSSRIVEDWLKKRKINEKSLEMLFRSRRATPRIDFDPSRHEFLFKEEGVGKCNQSQGVVDDST